MNLRPNQDIVSTYFTKVKSLWEELTNYRPFCSCNLCNCDGVKNLGDHYQNEYVMTFLMGLNDLYTQALSQILLVGHLPPINCVFSMILQEERQRKLGNLNIEKVMMG